MEKNTWNFRKFLQTPAGLILCFLVIFYIMTFGVYYFYSPGPEERRELEEQKSKLNLGTMQMTQQTSQFN